MLHNGYNQSDKNSPLNIKSKTIQNLYKTWFNYQLNKYQQHLCLKWKYLINIDHQVYIYFCVKLELSDSKIL